MANSIKRHKGLFYEVFWSEDDNGFYAEVFNREGKQLHITKMANSIKRHKGLFYEVFWSEDDNGFYAEVFNREGKQLHITELSPLGLDADGFAKTWIEAQS